MAKQSTFTPKREHHQDFANIVSEYAITGGPAAQEDIAWQFEWDGHVVPEDWIDQVGYAIDAPVVIPAGSVKSIRGFRDSTYLVR